MIQFPAQLWRMSKDHEGEITLVLKVPQSHKDWVVGIPEMMELDVQINAEPKKEG